MPKKSAIEKYKSLKRKANPGLIDESDEKAMKLYRRSEKLWPEVQRECRESHRDWIAMHALPDDRDRAVSIVKRLAERLRKFGFDQNASRLVNSLMGREDEKPPSQDTTRKRQVVKKKPSLLERLELRTENGFEYEEWHGIHVAIAAYVASGMTGSKSDPLQLASELQNRLEEIRLGAGAEGNPKRAGSSVSSQAPSKAKPKGKGGRKPTEKIAQTPQEKQIWELHKNQKKSAAVIAKDLGLKRADVKRTIGRIGARARRKKARQNSDAPTK